MIGKTKLLVVFGTRPEAIKMAPLLLRLQQEKGFDTKVCVTGQHREMLDQVLDVFGITPDYALQVMTHNQDLFALTAKIITAMRDVMTKERPALVLVHGDTTTTFAAALSAFYAHIPVGHVEAGLRTGDLEAPFPEEANRVLTSHLATLHFAPTDKAKLNLLHEGIAPERIWVTGNTVVDALLWMQSYLNSNNVSQWENTFGSAWKAIQKNQQLVLITGHRRENFGEGFQNICAAIRQLAQEHQDWAFVYPVHLNPNVREPVYQRLGGIPNVHLLEPLPYAPFVYLMTKCTLIITDSGGIQEEAPSLGKPVLVMRERTERPEAIEAGCIQLVGTDTKTIVDETTRIMSDPLLYKEMSHARNPYGDGLAAERIVSVLKKLAFKEV